MAKMTEEACLSKIRQYHADYKDDTELRDKKIREVLDRWARNNSMYDVGDILQDECYIGKVVDIYGQQIPGEERLTIGYRCIQFTKKLEPYKNRSEVNLTEYSGRSLKKIGETHFSKVSPNITEEELIRLAKQGVLFIEEPED